MVNRGAIVVTSPTYDPRLFQTEHYSMTACGYAVPNGAYDVNLLFAETYAGITGAGQRVFSVNVEGTAINNIDVFAQAGGANKALVKSATVNVTDGQLSLTFAATVNNPEINGIEILSHSGPIPTPTPTPVPTPTPTPAPSGAISNLLVGNNVWMNPSGAVWAVSGNAGLKIIRIGGNAYDGGGFPDFGTLDGWVANIKGMGATPMIQISKSASPAFAASVVNHYNQNNNRVTYWNIGNETQCNNNSEGAAAAVAGYVRPIASAMKAADPTIKIFVPDECDWQGVMYNSLLGGSNDISGKDANGHYYIDGVSFHRYPQGISDYATAGANDIIARIIQAKTRVDYVNQLRGRTGADAIQWGIGEFNAASGAGVCSFGNGQMFAQVYGAIMKYGGIYGETWSMFESGGNCGGTDFSFVNADMSPRSSYWHMQMVSQNFSGSYLDGTKNLAGIRTYGSIDTAKGQISVMLVNVDAGGHACTIRLNGDPVAGECQVNIPAGVAKSFAQSITGQTTMVLVFDLQGNLKKTIRYANGMGAPAVTNF